MPRNRSRLVSSFFALITFVFLLSACGGGGSSPATPPKTNYYSSATEIPMSGPDVPGVEIYDAAVRSLMIKWNVPGMTVAVVRNGKLIVARGYGYAEYDAREPMQPGSRMRISSASKTFTAVAIIHLVEKGKLNFDDRFLDILTQYQVPANGDQRLRSVTIRNLLQHSGGWDRGKSGDPMGMSKQVVDALHVPAPATCSDTIRYMMSKPLDFNPGDHFVYSNFGYCILGRVVEKLTGMRYEDYVRSEILAGMDVHGMSTGRTLLSQRGPYEARYYDYSGAPMYDSVMPGGGKVEGPYGAFSVEAADAHGSWVASSIDLTRFMTSIDGTRQKFWNPDMATAFSARPSLVTQDPTPAWNGTQNSDGWYGMGIFVQPDTQDMTWWHWGNSPGDDSIMLRNGRGWAWAALANTLPKDAVGFMNDLDALLWSAFNSGVQGSDTDLYEQFPSPDVPSSGVQN